MGWRGTYIFGSQTTMSPSLSTELRTQRPPIILFSTQGGRQGEPRNSHHKKPKQHQMLAGQWITTSTCINTKSPRLLGEEVHLPRWDTTATPGANCACHTLL